MVTSEGNMTNIKDTKTKVTVGDRKTLTGTKRVDWHFCHKRNGKLHDVTLTNMAVITGLYVNLFSVTWALQKGFELTSENSHTIRYRIRIFSNHGGMLQNTMYTCNFIVYESCC